MKLRIKNMNENLSIEVTNWKYDRPYDFYNNEMTDEVIAEKLDGSYQALIDDNGELVGFFCVGKSAQVPAGNKVGAYEKNFVDMGLGMHPNLAGQGKGYEFCSYILDYIQENHRNTPIRLSVATFNKRAVHLYEKLGFVKEDKFNTDTTEFITMVK
jgi:ribosomal-protein-alanine N-acetyltransferase